MKQKKLKRLLIKAEKIATGTNDVNALLRIADLLIVLKINSKK